MTLPGNVADALTRALAGDQGGRQEALTYMISLLSSSRETVLIHNTASELRSRMSSGTQGSPNVYRATGDFVFDEALDWSAYDDIDVDFGPYRVTTTLAPSVGLADTATNSLIYAAPTIGAATTLSATAAPGARTLALTSATGFASTSLVRLRSENGSNVPSAMSGDVSVVSHIYQGTDLTGTTFTTVDGVRWWAYTGATSEVEVLTRTPKRIRIFGGYWDCSGGTMACAISMDGVIGIDVIGATFKGFSRAAVMLYGGTMKGTMDFTHDGECNAVLYCDSAHFINIPKYTSPHVVDDKVHANGVARAIITLRSRCYGCNFGTLDLQWGALGFQNWASDALYVARIFGDNLDGSIRADEAGADGMSGTQCGVVYDGGATSLTEYTGFGAGGYVGHIESGANNVFEAASTQVAVYWHDSVGCNLGGVTGVFNGAAASAYDLLAISDAFQSEIANITCKGAQDAIRTENQACSVIRNVDDENAAGSGSNSGRLFTFQHAGTGYGLQIDTVRTSNRAALFAFTGGSFNNPYMEIRNFIYDSWQRPADKMIVVLRDATGGTVNQNDLWEMYDTDSGYPLVRIGATGGLEKMVCMVRGLNDSSGSSTYLMAQLLGPGRVANISCTGAVAIGDRIRHGSTAGKGIVDNSATFDLVLGRALREVASGTNVIPVY